MILYRVVGTVSECLSVAEVQLNQAPIYLFRWTLKIPKCSSQINLITHFIEPNKCKAQKKAILSIEFVSQQ